MYDRRLLSGNELTPAPLGEPAGVAGRGRWEVVDLAWRRKGGIAACTLLGIVAALSFSLLAQPRYTASTKLIVDPSDLRTVDRSLQNTNSFSDAQIAQVEDQVRVITSNRVLGAVVDAEKLAEDPEFGAAAPSWMSTLAAAIGLRDAAGADPRLKATRALAKDVDAKREERTYVVDVRVTTNGADTSARLANAIVAAFLQANADQRAEAARRIAGSLESRLDALKASVNTAEQSVEDYKRAHNLVAAVGQNVTEQQLAEANARLGDARKGVEQAKSRYAQMSQAQRGGDPGAVPEALQSTTITNLRTQLAQIMRKEGDVAATLGPRHPDMFEIRGEERNLRTLIKDELGRIAATSRSDLDRALADRTAAQNAFDALSRAVTTNSNASVRLRELERDVEASRTVYESFLVRTREVTEQQGVDAANVSVIAPAQVLEAKAWPPRPALLLMAGAVIGAATGLGLALLRDHAATVPRLRGEWRPAAGAREQTRSEEVEAARASAWNAEAARRRT